MEKMSWMNWRTPIRRICGRLADPSLDPVDAASYQRLLKSAAAKFAIQQKEWNKVSEPDTPQDEARQSYRTRETDSADGFAEGLKLFNPKKKDSEKKQD
jgi:hypothetical protein